MTLILTNSEPVGDRRSDSDKVGGLGPVKRTQNAFR